MTTATIEEAKTLAFWTRRAYMAESTAEFIANGKSTLAAHRAYYSQFVTARTLEYVEWAFGVGALAEALARDMHLNTLSILRWERLCWYPTGGHGRGHSQPVSGSFDSHLPYDRDAINAAGEILTRSTLMCIAKEAARLLVERAQVTTSTP